MSKQQDERPTDERTEAALAALAAWIEDEIAREAAAWRDTTQDTPLWQK